MKKVINDLDFSILKKAHSLYFCNEFEKGYSELQNYINKFRLKNFRQILNKKNENLKIKLSIIIVTHNKEDKLKNCLKSLNAIFKSNNIEIVLLSNNLSLSINVNKEVSTFVELGENILPSEARNIGSIMANGDWLYFLDDDSEVHYQTINHIIEIIKLKKFLASRGKIIPLKKNNPSFPPHYDLGDQSIHTKLITEGNLLIKKSLFLSSGGFDPLMYAHEGLDLTSRVLKLVYPSMVLYDPNMIIFHDQKEDNGLKNKLKRNEIGTKFMNYKKKNNFNKITGLIFLIGDSADKYLSKVLSSFANKSDNNDITIVVLTRDIEKALILSRFFITKLKIIVSYPNASNFWAHINQSNVSYFFIFNKASIFEPKVYFNYLNESLDRNILASINFKGSIIGKVGWVVRQKELRSIANDILLTQVNEINEFLKINLQDKVKKAKFKKNSHELSIDDVIVVSFHTKDDYYSKKANDLKISLHLLGIKYEITEIDIPFGMKWPDVCRKKVSYMYEKFIKYNKKFKKLIWIDIDCNFEYFPNFILDFDVDFMAFGRGFRTSKNLGKRKASRRWEPCFFVFSMNEKCMRLLKTANDLENSLKSIKATDDYFFEESWRRHGKDIIAFEIPGEMCDRHNFTNINKIQKKSKGLFFVFGESGNVKEFKGKVEQHEIDIDNEQNKFVVRNNKDPFSHLLKISAEDKNNLKSIEKTFGEGANELQRELVRSLRCYESNGVRIPLYWWIRPAPGNMGDWLSPYIVHKLTGLPVKYENINNSKLISLGSIGKFIKDHHVVWGTGISSSDTHLNKNAKYLAVRGPYTAEALKNAGGKPPSIFGDPAIVLKDIYKPKKLDGINFEYGLVRHYIHQECKVNISEDILDINILMSSPRDIEKFIDTLYSLKAILTTSLHVNIICQTYKIPCRLISIKNEIKTVHGDGVKYRDFYEGAGLKFLNHVKQPEIINKNFVESIVSNEFISDKYAMELTSVFMNHIKNDPNSVFNEDYSC